MPSLEAKGDVINLVRLGRFPVRVSYDDANNKVDDDRHLTATVAVDFDTGGRQGSGNLVTSSLKVFVAPRAKGSSRTCYAL